jgi:hypothetical protein
MYLSRSAPAIVGLAALVSFGTLSYAEDDRDRDPDLAPNGKGIGTVYGHGKSPDHAGPARTQRNSLSGNGIFYHGGPLMVSPTTNIHYIWYGNWGGNTATSILPAFANSIGGSPYFNINTTYTNSAGKAVTNSCSLSTQANDNYSRGKNLSDNDVLAIVAAQNPNDTNGVYFVLTSADVNESSGFCTQYCAWHASATINGQNIKLGFIGNPDRCPSSCSVQSNSPNGNAGADAMASLIAHELEEAVTDPNGNAWYDRRGEENADKCAWTFGQVYQTSNGSYANMKLGANNYLIQQNWVNANGGFCALSH